MSIRDSDASEIREMARRVCQRNYQGLGEIPTDALKREVERRTDDTPSSILVRIERGFRMQIRDRATKLGKTMQAFCEEAIRREMERTEHGSDAVDGEDN